MPTEFLTREDFTLTANTANVNTTVAEFQVPRQYAFRFLSHAARLVLGTVDKFNGTGAQTAFTLTNLPTRSRGFGPLDTDSVQASVNGAIVAVTSVNFSTGVVTLTAAPAIGTNNVQIYYAPQTGRYTIEVFSADERRHDTYGNGAIRRLNASNQEDVNQLFRIDFPTNWLPQDYLVRVQINASWVADWSNVFTSGNNGTAPNPFSQIQVPYERRDLRSFKPEELVAAYQSLG